MAWRWRLRRRSFPGGRRAWYGAAPPASRLLRIACGDGPAGRPGPRRPLRPLGGRHQGPGRRPAPCPRTAPCWRPPHMVNTERVIYRHCCKDPLSPRTWLRHPCRIRGGGARWQGGITSHKNAAGTQEHQRSGAQPVPLAYGQHEPSGIAPDQHGCRIHVLWPGTDGVRVTEVRSRVRVLLYRSNKSRAAGDLVRMRLVRRGGRRSGRRRWRRPGSRTPPRWPGPRRDPRRER